MLNCEEKMKKSSIDIMADILRFLQYRNKAKVSEIKKRLKLSDEEF